MGVVQYVKDTKGELKHVSWPTRRQSFIYTTVVVVISLVTAAYLGALDWMFAQVLELFFVK